MLDESQQTEKIDGKASSCLGWLMLWGLLGVLMSAIAGGLTAMWCERYEPERSRQLLAEQIEQLRQGEINCLVQPDPRFLDELLADREATAKICELYMGRDVADPRFKRLRELPSLRCIALVFAENSDVLLKHLGGMETVEVLSLDHTWPSAEGIQAIGRFPHLRSLCVGVGKPSELEGLRNHPKLENILLVTKLDKELIPILQSLPQLRKISIEYREESKMADDFKSLLEKSLPRCKCSVLSVER